ncbi:MAG: histidinol-phosphatase, partial [Paenibacillaceae bacterium]|nr:histidinol-phosphatase [Paenibacillaceae bacterium]
AIEVNTSGKTKDVGGWYPSDEILEMALHYGVSATFGSDAHDTERVADDWELVAHRLKEIGFDHWVYYSAKKRVAVPL